MFNPHWVRGKTIETIDMRYLSDGRGGRTSQPVIIFTDGSRLLFRVDETDTDEYGVRPLYIKP